MGVVKLFGQKFVMKLFGDDARNVMEPVRTVACSRRSLRRSKKTETYTKTTWYAENTEGITHEYEWDSATGQPLQISSDGAGG